MIHRQLPPKPLHGFAGSIGSPHRTRKSSCPESEFSLASSGSRQLQSRAHAGYDKPDAASGSFAQEPRPGGDLTEREEWADVIFVIFASFVSCHPHGGGERDTARRRRRRSKKAWKRQSTCRAGARRELPASGSFTSMANGPRAVTQVVGFGRPKKQSGRGELKVTGNLRRRRALPQGCA